MTINKWQQTTLFANNNLSHLIFVFPWCIQTQMLQVKGKPRISACANVTISDKNVVIWLKEHVLYANSNKVVCNNLFSLQVKNNFGRIKLVHLRNKSQHNNIWKTLFNSATFNMIEWWFWTLTNVTVFANPSTLTKTSIVGFSRASL